MRNVIILGCGRSGTSMVAGTVAKAGYYMGDTFIPSRSGNPKGFFETFEVNKVNEAILAQATPNKPRLLGRWLFPDRFSLGQRWLAAISVGTRLISSPKTMRMIQRLTRKEPYCFKDPRFSYTLPVWRPYLRNAVFVCVFRDPASTAFSIIKESQQPYLRGHPINFDQATEVWTLMYRHILEIHRHEGNWLFIHFNQVLEEDGLTQIEHHVQTEIDRTFPDFALRRAFSDQPVPAESRHIYGLLCDLAEYVEPNANKSQAELSGPVSGSLT